MHARDLPHLPDLMPEPCNAAGSFGAFVMHARGQAGTRPPASVPSRRHSSTPPPAGPPPKQGGPPHGPSSQRLRIALHAHLLRRVCQGSSRCNQSRQMLMATHPDSRLMIPSGSSAMHDTRPEVTTGSNNEGCRGAAMKLYWQLQRSSDALEHHMINK